MGNENLDNLMFEETISEQVVECDETISQECCSEKPLPNKKKTRLKRETKRMLFYWSFMIFPVAQMLLMYFYVNFSSFALAFTRFEQPLGGQYIKFATFENFEVAFELLQRDAIYLKNSAINYVLNFITGMGLGTLFSFYVYKEYPLASFFKIMLFLPSLISGVILALIFKYMVTDVYQYLAEKLAGATDIPGLLHDPKYMFGAVLFYNVWVNFGTNVILMTGSMSGINDSLVEAAELDGITAIKEFWHITLPMIYPTLITFTITGMSGFFVNDLSVYIMLGYHAPDEVSTFGFKFFCYTKEEIYVKEQAFGRYTYPEMAALGMIFSAITFVLMTTVKKLMEKFGPKTY